MMCVKTSPSPTIMNMSPSYVLIPLFWPLLPAPYHHKSYCMGSQTLDVDSILVQEAQAMNIKDIEWRNKNISVIPSSNANNN